MPWSPTRPRAGVPFLAAAVLTGCGVPSLEIVARSTMDAQVNGVALSEDGSYGFAGMFQQTCDFDTSSGSIGKDHDAGPGLELVLDVHAGRGLFVLDGAVGELRQSGGDTLEGRALSGAGAVHGRILDADTHVLISEADGICALQRHTEQGLASQVTLDAAACGPNTQLVADRDTGVVFIGDRDRLLRVRGDEVERIDEGNAAALTYDPQRAQLYAGAVGGGALRALDDRGALLWTAQLDGALIGLAALPDHAATLVATAVDGDLRLLALDAETGDPAGVLTLESTRASGLIASADGSVAGLLAPDTVRMFTIRPLEQGAGR